MVTAAGTTDDILVVLFGFGNHIPLLLSTVGTRARSARSRRALIWTLTALASDTSTTALAWLATVSTSTVSRENLLYLFFLVGFDQGTDRAFLLTRLKTCH